MSRKKLENRKMKTIALLVAVLAMVGFAEAWDTVDTAQYQYTHQVYMQANSPTSNNLMQGANSQVTFNAPNPLGTGTSAATGTISNTLNWANADILGPDGTWPVSGLQQPSQTDTLTQGGAISLKTSALDPQDSVPEVQASLSKFQNLHFSGDYWKVAAGFSDSGSVGIQNGVTSADNIRLYESSNTIDPYVEAHGSNTAGTSWAGFTEADVGVSSTAGLNYDMNNNVKTLSGSATSYASFTGGFLANNGVGNTAPGTAGSNYITASTGTPFNNNVWFVSGM